MPRFLVISAVVLSFLNGGCLAEGGKKGDEDFVEKQYGVRYADTCEVCKYLVTELDAELTLTGKSIPEVSIVRGVGDRSIISTHYRNFALGRDVEA